MKIRIGTITKQLCIITFFSLIFVLSVASVPYFAEKQKQIKAYIIYKGETYYRCSTQTKLNKDTIINPAGIIIIESKTISTTYDHFKCK